MEHEVVMNAELPLIILYPATKEADKLMFLGKTGFFKVPLHDYSIKNKKNAL